MFDEISKTPLHYAAESGHIDIIRVLLEAGADVNANEEARIATHLFAMSPTSVRWLSPSSLSIPEPIHGFLAGCS